MGGRNGFFRPVHSTAPPSDFYHIFHAFVWIKPQNHLYLHTDSRKTDHTVDVAQLVRVTDCGSEGRGFESHLPPCRSPKGDLFLSYAAPSRHYRGEEQPQSLFITVSIHCKNPSAGIKSDPASYQRPDRFVYSDSGGIRTRDPQLRRLLLYPTELRNHHPRPAAAQVGAKINLLFLLSKTNRHFTRHRPLRRHTLPKPPLPHMKSGALQIILITFQY